ncbi:GNAT family N-acetyltransferase [Ruminococcaceae bacterium OttesenSCG-928-D13]|nr:GNAT family N-acetyltransferase [Ruminococcaceae bacterium OttesenSCG-928-D13]
MIREAAGQDDAFILEKARAATGIGPRLEVDLRLLAENPKLPCKFYRVGQSALFEHTGVGGTLLGTPEDSAEFSDFLTLLGVRQLTSDGWLPPGWTPDPLHVVVFDPALPTAPPKPVPVLEESPAPGEIMAVLESSGPISTPAIRDGAEGFYADLCVRLNHGYAAVYGVREAPDGPLVSTAGAYCIGAEEAYLSGVETHPEHRGKGYAAALLGALCRRYSGPRRVSLLCRPRLVPYYRKLGFAQSPAKALDAARPDPL